jgi:hypothetical protein
MHVHTGDTAPFHLPLRRPHSIGRSGKAHLGRTRFTGSPETPLTGPLKVTNSDTRADERVCAEEQREWQPDVGSFRARFALPILGW